MRIALSIALLSLGLSAGGAAQAQFTQTPEPLLKMAVRSVAETARQYRNDAARHLYASYPERIYQGQLPPLLYAIAVIDTEIDERGQVVNVVVRREPAAAKEVTPWIVSMIRKAGPFPPAVRMRGRVKYTDVWLVDKAGNFQLDTLTEGQASE